MCTKLRQCSAALLSDSTCSISANTTLKGALDLCSVEGVVGGATVPNIQSTSGKLMLCWLPFGYSVERYLALIPAQSRTCEQTLNLACSCGLDGMHAMPFGCLLPVCLAALAPGLCWTDSDCKTTNGSLRTCSFRNSTDQCVCSDGIDMCTPTGTCIDYCSSASVSSLLTRASQVPACNPDNNIDTCSGGLICTASDAGVQLVCSPLAGLQVSRLGGVCLPSTRMMLAAQFSPDGGAVMVTLNAAPKAASFDCAKLFSSSQLGTAWCVADSASSTLLVKLGPDATLQPGNTLSLKAGQAYLVDKLQWAAAFTGSVAVTSCMPNCMQPTAVITGPQVSIIMHMANQVCLTRLTGSARSN